MQESYTCGAFLSAESKHYMEEPLQTGEQGSEPGTGEQSMREYGTTDEGSSSSVSTPPPGKRTKISGGGIVVQLRQVFDLKEAGGLDGVEHQNLKTRILGMETGVVEIVAELQELFDLMGAGGLDDVEYKNVKSGLFRSG
jgi:hypothetical protein